MKTLKQIFCAMMLCATICCLGEEVFTETVNGLEWTYRVVNGEAVLGGNNNAHAIDTSTFGIVDIPSMLGNYSVRNIGKAAFRDCSAITLVTIPSGVINIENESFRGCPGLMEIYIPESVTNVGSGCFFWCEGLSKVRLPDNLEDIKDSMFEGCHTLSDINMPSHLKRIGDRAFQYCGRLAEMTIADGVTSIVNQAFYECSGLTNIVIPSSVVHIGGSAFRNTSLNDVMIPGSVKSLGSSSFSRIYTLTNAVLASGIPGISSYMFEDCSKLKRIMIPSSVNSIGNYAFTGCRSLPAVLLPELLRTIGNYAFQGCTALEEIAIPGNVLIVGGYAFKGCTNLQSIKFLSDAPMADITTFENNHPDCTAYVSRKSTGWGVNIPGEWMGIKIDYYDPALYTVRFDANGGSLGTVTNEVSYGEGEAFRNLPVPTKGGCFFVGWFTTSEGDMRITEGMLVSGDMTLYAHWKESAPELTIEDGVLVHVDLNGEKSIEIPPSVSSIAAEAFSGCQEMERITIPESVTSIPFSTFANCDKLWANWYKAMVNSGSAMETVSLTVTNVVVHYVTTSVQSEAVTPPETTGIVNVIAEVSSGGPVAIASTWAEQYPGFATKFGSDFTAALTKPTGKRDGAGNAMLVWQDFVAGTDPTNPDDVFKASITFDKETGAPVICWTPELPEQEAAKRLYRKYGKVRLADGNWTPIDGDASDYNFFKVTVEMR